MTRPTDRQLAIAGIIVLLLAVLAVVADADGAKRLDRPLLQRIDDRTLERAAERAVSAGRIRSTRWGDATPWLRNISRELVRRAFAGDAERWALCVLERESGGNPGAISRTGDYGLPQINRASHPWVDYRRILVDPPYAIDVMVTLSDGGAHRSPWKGYGYVC